ncbi:MAG: hypothetical protein RL726_1820, partial [Actinomycetota bacterium]
VDDVKIGDTIVTTVRDGSIASTVTETKAKE